VLVVSEVSMRSNVKRAVRAATWFMLASWGPYHGLAQDVRIRVIDVGNGRPLAKKRIRIDFSNGYPEQRVGPLLRTGPDGVATLHLSQPLPQRLFVVVDTGGYTSWSPCSKLDFQVSQVLLSGKVAERTPCKTTLHDQLNYKAGPGEIVVFTKRYSRWNGWKDFPR